jgi:rhodanese-related sulfurtransferase
MAQTVLTAQADQAEQTVWTEQTVQGKQPVQAGQMEHTVQVRTAESAAAIAHFEAKLQFETDVSDVHAALAAATTDVADTATAATTDASADVAVTVPGPSGAGPGFVLIDTRSEQAWNQGRIPGAVHLPTRRIAAEAGALIPAGTPVVTYCWGPGCNGATRAALEFARLGYPVKEMIGGFEYWVREGFAYDTAWGRREPAADPLTAPVDGTACAC